MPEEEGIILDIESGLKSANGDRALYMELLGTFVQEHGPAIDQIRAALDQGDRELAMRLTHTIKGAAAVIGAFTLSRGAAELEQRLEQEETAVTDKALTRVARELDRVMNIITTIDNG